MIPKEYEKYEKTVTVACVNWSGVWGEKAANLEKIKTRVVEATKVGANIIAFPELALSGYECGEDARRYGKSCSMHQEAAETIPGPSTEEVAKLAKELDVYILFGMSERDKEHPEIIYISAAVVAPEGVLGSYRKVNLGPPPKFTETFCFKPGSELPVFETRYGPIGVQICKDFWIVPECSRILFLKGARLIFNLAGSPAGPDKREFMTQQTGCRAAESHVFTASVNHVGKEKTIAYFGHSTIAGPAPPRMTRIFAQGGYEEEIVSATLNFESLHHSQRISDVKKEVNWKLIAREYQKLSGM